MKYSKEQLLILDNDQDESLVSAQNSVNYDNLNVELAAHIFSSSQSTIDKINEISSIKLSTRIALYRKLNQALIALQDMIFESFSLDQLSKEVAMSKFHLIRHFKQVYGLTPNQYYIKEKLKKAYQLLIDTDLPVKDVAHKLGYPDSTSFGKQFRKAYGVSPSFYTQAQ